MDWQNVLQALDTAVITQESPNGQITYANAKAESMLGLSAAELLKLNADDPRWHLIDEAGEPIRGDGHPGIRALRTKQAVRGVVLGIRCGESERAWVSVSAVPNLHPDGSVKRVIVSFSDITTHQRRVQEQGAIYRTVFASITQGLVVLGRDASIVAANQAAERVFGLTEDQMAGHAAADPRLRFVREDGEPVKAGETPAEQALSTGRTAGPSILGVHRSTGERVWLSVRADPLHDLEDGSLVGAIATFTDVTQARAMQDTLETSRAQSERVLEAIPGVVYQYTIGADGEARLSIVGGRVLEVLGFSQHPSEITLELLMSLPSETYRAELARAIETAVTKRSPFRHTVRAELPTLGTRWLRIIGAPDTSAHWVLYTGVIVDVTAEIQMAEALRLTQRREAMAQMSAGIAHNFNNMLEVILPNVEMAREHVDGAAREMLDDAGRAAHSAADLVRRMLEIGRTDLANEDEVCDLAPLVKEGLHLARRTLDPAIHFHERVRISSAFVRGRASVLQQVLLNLLFNARDAVREVASPEISVELRADSGGSVRLSVKDNGHGIPRAVLARLGEPFFTTKPPGEGTGLGLASVIRAVHEAGGTWEVTSTVDRGTAFDLRFPLHAGAAGVESPRTSLAAGTIGGTVVVIDDEELVRDVLSRQITMAGFVPLRFVSAEAALQNLSSSPPRDLRCILLDLSMPGLSGARALPLLQQACPGTAVIVMSGHTRDTLGLETAAAVLQKPMGFRDLRETLVRVASGL